MPLIFLPQDAGSTVGCASVGFSSHHPGCAASGRATCWLTSKAGQMALEAKMAAEIGLIPTETQDQALEKKKLDDQNHSEIEATIQGIWTPRQLLRGRASRAWA